MENKLKVLYVNERMEPRKVYVNEIKPDSAMNFYPMRAEIITLDAPPGAIAWIQEWADYTLISYMKEKTDEIAPVPVS